MTTENETLETEAPEVAEVETKEVETTEEVKAEETTEEKKETPDKVQLRINKLTREKYELQAELEKIRQESEKAKPEPQPIVKGENEEEQDYLKRLVAEGVKETLTSMEAKKAKDAKSQEIVNSYNERAEKFAETHDDYYDVVNSHKETLPPEVAREVLLSEKSAELIYYFGKNPDVVKKMGQMSTIGQATEYIRVLNELEKPVQKISETPAPVPDTNGSIVATTDISKMSTEDFIKLRNKKEGK